ncbi:B12-binding domain-containing radical SAM protein [Planctomycetota bacterium]
MSVIKTNILLTTVCRPFGGKGEGDSVGAELFHAQLTREQGIFSYRQVIRCWGLDYIAENIHAPSVVLHYPSEREFVRELMIRKYEYIGINFVVATFHKLKRMTQLIRRHSPGAKIILGGYGTVLSDEELLPYGSFICREEGISYMRRLLGEDTNRPIVHPYAPIKSPRIYSYPLKTKVAHITGGLGCPNGCDFCCTSHFFKRRYIPFVQSGKELYKLILDMEQKAEKAGDVLGSFIFIDEDFFIQEKRAREFLQCVREKGKILSIMGFGSVRGLSKFTADEIAEMGFDVLWTSFEGTESHFSKLKGKTLPELYSSLNARGVAILSSMIIGLPYQDRKKIMEEFRIFTGLCPSLWQVLIYFAFPGTPLHQRMLEENRFLPEYRRNPDYRTFDGFSMHFNHPHFSAVELETLQRELYRKNFEILGPSLLQVIRIWFEGYCNLKNSPNPLLKGRADRMKEYVKNAVPALYPTMLFGPNRGRRADARRLFHQIEQEMGGLSIKQRLFCLATIPLSYWTWLTTKLNILQQPKLMRIQYPATYTNSAEDQGIEQRKSSQISILNTNSSKPFCSSSVELENQESSI